MTDLAHAATVLSVALGCGLLVGIERERRKGDGPGRAFAGLRTFSVACLTGAAAALTQIDGVVVTGAALVAALGVLAYRNDRSDDPGVTTEVALLLTYLVGVMCAYNQALAAGLAVGLTALLAGRNKLHNFARDWLRPAEVRDGILLAALVLMALPLAPDRPLWGEVLNPHTILQLLALLLAVQSLAHLCRRLLQARHAVALSALASGFVSSTATIATMGLAVREGRSGARLMAGGGLLSCVPTLALLLLVASAVRPAWLGVLWLPALAGGALALAWGWWLVRGGADVVVLATGATQKKPVGSPEDNAGERMFSLRGAAAVAALLSGIQAMVHALHLWQGEAGLLVGTLLGALVDLHSAMSAVFASTAPGADGAGLQAVMLALLVHAGSKSVTAVATGGWRYLAWLAPGLWVHTLLTVALIAFS
ncbi:DUF4010 domain-containing protein [Hydrogenophaga sp.]|uniref:MgtC/SapB family protein n=1 Tax=Hydrogenophaga sp. TaxID=1904254 RepID=UPI002721C7EA|nr:DUF4010 domain-containing protein [Hydrogenophaga sp.]MDO8906381.1 DUF4010 domain-containing protein [Hydrogenophaga sp.]